MYIHPPYSKLTSVVSTFNLTQIVTEPTHTNSSATLIDFVFASSPIQVESCSAIPPLANSDYNGPHVKISIKTPKRVSKAVLHRIWKYSLIDFDAMANLAYSGLLRKPKSGLQVSKSYNMPIQKLLVQVKDQLF